MAEKMTTVHIKTFIGKNAESNSTFLVRDDVKHSQASIIINTRISKTSGLWMPALAKT